MDNRVYLEKSVDSVTDTVTLPALRGEITDRNGNKLVSNKLCLSVQAGVGITPENYSKLISILDVSEEEYPFGESFIVRDITSAAASAIESDKMDNVHVIKDYKREYIDSPKMSHILGYTGNISPEEYEELKNEGYHSGDLTGKSGVEKTSEKFLRGADGKRVTKNESTVFERQPENGCNVILTVDKNLQDAVENELSKQVLSVKKNTGFNSGGAVVVLDVNSGAVLAMASNPDYNLASVSADYHDLLEGESNPLINRCISGCYEPGSTFKPLVALAALEEGVITENEIIKDLGIYTYYAPTYTPSCHIWNEFGKTHGDVNLEKALSESCNYFFYETGRRLGIENIALYARSFGFGKKTGIELEGEQSGTLASPDVKEWYGGDTLQAAIGQSVNMFTPLQMASFAAAVANGGKVNRPYVIAEVVSAYGDVIQRTLPEFNDMSGVSEKHFEAVRNGMKQCVLSGTATSAFKDYSFTCAGKTGTAQVPEGPENGVFIGYAPFENPKFAISVVVEHGGGGYSVELAGKIMEKCLKLYNMY